MVKNLKLQFDQHAIRFKSSSFGESIRPLGLLCFSQLCYFDMMGAQHFEVWEGGMCNMYSLCMCVFITYVSGKTRVDLRRSSGFCSGGTSKSLLFVDEVLYPQ